MRKKFLILMGIVVYLFTANVSAQTLVTSPLMGEKKGERIFERLGVFATTNFGFSSYTMTFENAFAHEELAGGEVTGYESDATYVERKQRMYTLGAIFGVSLELVKNLHVTGGIGGYYIDLEDKDTSYSEYTFDLIPSPGFAAFFGLSWQPQLSDHVSFVLGVQGSYLSTYGLSGYTFDEQTASLDGNTSSEVDNNTTDVDLHLFYIQPHLGFEWRPVNSWLANSFGVYYSAVLSVAQMTVERKTYRSDQIDGAITENGALSSRKVDLWVKPIQPLGAYYGWYFIIPHAGTLGMELQLGNRWNVALSYQYEF